MLAVPVWSAQKASTWPQDGSVVRYQLSSSFAAPDGSYRQSTQAGLVLQYAASSGTWGGTCSGQTTETLAGVATLLSWSTDAVGAPAMAPQGLHRGDAVTPGLLDAPGFAPGCRQTGFPVLVAGHERHATSVADARGRPIVRTAWVAAEPADTSAYQDAAIAWDQRTGLALDWSRAGTTGSFGGRLVETDAFG